MTPEALFPDWLAAFRTAAMERGVSLADADEWIVGTMMSALSVFTTVMASSDVGAALVTAMDAVAIEIHDTFDG